MSFPRNQVSKKPFRCNDEETEGPILGNEVSRKIRKNESVTDDADDDEDEGDDVTKTFSVNSWKPFFFPEKTISYPPFTAIYRFFSVYLMTI